MKVELALITSHAPPTIDDWVYAPENFPFENLGISASDAAVNLNVDDVRSILSVGSNPDAARSSLEIQEEKRENSEKKKDNVAVGVE
jgi:hypothetical protein